MLKANNPQWTKILKEITDQLNKSQKAQKTNISHLKASENVIGKRQ